MTIKIKCPICGARNALTMEHSQCRRCEDDLSLLYMIKGHSYKKRLQLLEVLSYRIPERKRLAEAALWLKAK